MDSQVETSSNGIGIPSSGAVYTNDCLLASLSKPSVGNLWQLSQVSSESQTNISIRQPGSVQERHINPQFEYKALLHASEDKTSLIRQIPGLAAGSIVLLHFDNHTQNIQWLWAVIRAGFIPAISTTFSADAHQRESHLRHLEGLLHNSLLLTFEALVSRYLKVQILSFHTVDALQCFGVRVMMQTC